LTEERFVDVAVVARRLGVSKVTVHNWAHLGKIEVVKQGNRFRIPSWELEALLERNRQEPLKKRETI
jgi:excisionase family DNA binding protein